ncbi:hypothetical protein K504DRAFT_493142, partial [Pleomassaria siparia CBS 279.74]
MQKKDTAVVDAWDDDWESLADKQEDAVEERKPTAEANISKAERKAKHAELNRKIWESAENPQPLLFLEARDNVPLKAAFKPNVMVLARKPPQVLSRNGTAAGMAGLSIDDDDSEEERRKENEASFEERKARAKIEREEKNRRYAEAREKIFGSPATDGSRGTSPNKNARGKSRGRGGRDSQPRSSNEQSPARTGAAGKQLYDPSYSPMPASLFVQKRDGGSRPETPTLEKPIREPRGPQAF